MLSNMTEKEKDQVSKNNMNEFAKLLEKMNELDAVELAVVNAYAKGFADRGKLLKKGA